MDDKLLIREVKKYEFLFNTESNHFNNRKYCKNAWIEISRTLDLPARYCCNKWKNLRHRFVKTFRRSLTKGCDEEKQNKWELFDDLLFLTKYIPNQRPRDPLDNGSIQDTSCPLLRSKRKYNNVQTTDEFDPELIAEVKKYPVLYDKKHTNYFERTCRTLLWNKIGEHLNISGEMAKKRWRILRDHFVRDFNRKQTLAASTVSEKPPIVWELYDNMLFLKDYIETNIIPDPKICQNNMIHQEEDTFEPSFLNGPDVLYRRLINEVKKYKCLLSTSFNVARKRQIAWMKISAKLNEPPLVLRGKWRYLRNRFVRECNSPDNSEWKLFDELLFLKDYIKTKNTEPGEIEETNNAILNEELEERNIIFVEDNGISTADLFPKMKKNVFYTKLIKEVKLHKPIYNPMDPNHRNTRLLGLLWHEISKKLKEPAHKCRFRWYTLRDRFIREFLNFKKNSHLDEFSWEFFHELMFLKDFIEVQRPDNQQEKLDRDASESLKNNHGEQIDCEQLIQEIRSRPELFSKKYMIRNHKEKCMKLWIEISNKMNCPVHCCQNKWKSLRRRFIVEYRKSIASKNFEEIRSLWPYYGIMEFLIPYIPSKKKKYNLDDSAEEWVNTKDESFDINNRLERNEETLKTKRKGVYKETSTDVLLLDNSSREEEQNDYDSLPDDTSEIIEIDCLDVPDDYKLSNENHEYHVCLLDNETQLKNFENRSNEIVNSESFDENRIISIQTFENDNVKAFPNYKFKEDSVNCRKQRDPLADITHGASNHHLEFIQEIYNKFLGLSREEQEETKMFYLNYLHKQIRRKHKDIELSNEEVEML